MQKRRHYSGAVNCVYEFQVSIFCPLENVNLIWMWRQMRDSREHTAVLTTSSSDCITRTDDEQRPPATNTLPSLSDIVKGDSNSI